MYKNGDSIASQNYRLVLLTSICSKILENDTHSQFMSHVDEKNMFCIKAYMVCKNNLVEYI